MLLLPLYEYLVSAEEKAKLSVLAVKYYFKALQD